MVSQAYLGNAEICPVFPPPQHSGSISGSLGVRDSQNLLLDFQRWMPGSQDLKFETHATVHEMNLDLNSVLFSEVAIPPAAV